MGKEQVRFLTLQKGQNTETTVFRLEKGWILRFVYGTTLHAHKLRLFCNHPQDKRDSFERNQYHEVKWQNASGMKSDCHDSYAEIKMVRAGSFYYYFTISGKTHIDDADGRGYILVDPTLKIGNGNKELTLDSIQCVSVLSKLLGPFEDWPNRLMTCKASGYNMIHFTPIQELGDSGSAYSLRNQHRLNPQFTVNHSFTFDDVQGFTEKMQTEWEVLTLTDLVFNHTSTCSPWIRDHPECAYNLLNSPHLKPAFLVDRILHYFNVDVADGNWEHEGIFPKVNNDHMNSIRRVLSEKIFPSHRIHEFYLVHVDNVVKSFYLAAQEAKKGLQHQDMDEENVKDTGHLSLEIIQDPQFRRLKSTVDMEIALKLYNTNKKNTGSKREHINLCCNDLRNKLQELNDTKKSQIDNHLNVAIDNYLANIYYRFVDPHGPRLGLVTLNEPLMHNYFAFADFHAGSLEKEEKMMFHENAKYIMASNGWVMNDNPLRNFAEPGSDIYLRRELICWGDSCKLRYGNSPEDCPFLWKFMKEYTEQTVRIAQGIRLDNCHSTPLQVAEYMLDAARQIRPDLYVIGELFTSSEATDNLFINRIGINSLIRESLSASSITELAHLVHRFGGRPIGSFVQPQVQPLCPSVAHAVFCDQTHDNESPIVKRCVYDLLPNSALVAITCCASGSNFGYDMLVPHHIHVVTETRLYPFWNSGYACSSDCSRIGLNTGIIKAKKIFNQLHYELVLMEYTELFVDRLDDIAICVTRHNPKTHHCIMLVARNSFCFPGNPQETGYIKPINVPGEIEEIIFEAKLVHSGKDFYIKNLDYLNGLVDYELQLQEGLKPNKSTMIVISSTQEGSTEIAFKNFPPGSVIALKYSQPPASKESILKVRSSLSQFGYLMRSYSGRSLFSKDSSNFRIIVGDLDLAAINRVLYRCNAEEVADGKGFDAYTIPNFGKMVYCGLQGVVNLLSGIRPSNDLGHPLCENLRNGDWLLDYIINRLLVHPGTKKLGNWFDEVFSHLRKIPRYLIPCYFDAIVTGSYMIIRDCALDEMSEFIQEGSTFVHALSMCSVQMCGFVSDAKLPPLASELLSKDHQCLTLSAGFPHFSTGFARNWGRDTFIAIRGLLLLTKRFDDARYMILGYAGCLRHGLIPNLLLEGTGARFNCRDAVWWWLQCIQDYCMLCSDGFTLLKDPVARLYPTDDSPVDLSASVIQPLYMVIQEALEKHAKGLKFRERDAGSRIDMHMCDKGFDNEIGVDWDTGFVFGGNDHNCGTWMDKMGSSQKAGNRGKPATPRDGSAVELVGLSKSAVQWLAEMNKQNFYPYDGVTDKHGNKISFNFWVEKIQKNFEKHFWINSVPVPANESMPQLIFRRGIYKDSVNSTRKWTDFQLRPNVPIAMVVAPELFTVGNAWECLTMIESHLLGPLGMKTLDPSDYQYCGDYHNDNNSDDYRVAQGFNYHQGPEWVWPLGYFLRAKLHFASILNKQKPGILMKTINFVKMMLTKHYEIIISLPWKSLPELTNSNGSYCQDGCSAQAWSVSCILEVLYDLEKLDVEN